VVRDIKVLPFIEVTCIQTSTLKAFGVHQFLTETDGAPKRRNPPEGGFFGRAEILNAFSGALGGAAPGIDPGTY